MNHLETVLSWFTLGFVSVLCGLVLRGRVYRFLPFFAVYSFELLASTVVVWLVYKAFGFNTLSAYFFYWSSLLLNAGVRSLAIAELCRYKLRAYRGIWALAWRGLIGMSVLFLIHAAFDTWGQSNHLAIYSLTVDRDLAAASVAILAALLLVHNYYRLSLEPLQRMIAAGICLVCAVDVVGDTILKILYTGYLSPILSANRTPPWSTLEPLFIRANDIWSTVHLVCFMAAVGTWCYAVRKPLPAPAEAPVLLPVEVYRELSPEINLRLATYNDRLVELLKP